MNRKWTVGSLIPGREISLTRGKAAVRPAEEKFKKPKTPEQPFVELRQGNVTCSVPLSRGTTLLDAALKQGCSVQFKCRKGTCGRCAVDIISGSAYLTERNEAEQKKLGTSPRRLACQAVLNG